MNSHQERVLQSFRRVHGWLVANPQFVAKNGPASTPALATQLDALTGIVTRAMDHATTQDTQLAQSLLISKDEREQRKEVLSGHMGTIAKVARALRGSVPGIGVLSIPKGNIQSTSLITSATVMARKAEIYASVLIEHGLPTDFVTQLEDAAAALKGSIDARGQARGARAGATRGLESELGLGRRVVDIMDATLTRMLRGSPEKLTEWKHVKRVTLRGSMSRASVSAVAVQPTAIQPLPTEIQASPTSAPKAA